MENNSSGIHRCRKQCGQCDFCFAVLSSKNVKRLLGKLYFAASVKGVSAYALLVLALYALHASPWVMAVAVILYWVFNMYMSDRVLRAAMDAKSCHHPHVQAAADKIFRSAGISHVRIYETESDDYNGMAVGMNVGRSMVILTSATLTLPQRVIEGILAHEAIHIKKRDVLSSQLLRFLYLGAVVGIFLLFEQHITHPEAHKIALWAFIMAIIILFQLYQSFVHNGWRCVLTTLAHHCWTAVTNKWLKP